MSLPIFVLREGVELPREGDCYIIAGNGIFLRKDTGFVQATVPLRGISILEELAPSVRLKTPKIPWSITWQAYRFFRAAYRKFGGEAIVLLHYNPDTDIYQLTCPEQVVTSVKVEYKADERLSGFQLLGDLHSHGSIPASHSEVDDRDEEEIDGIHVTFGDIHRRYFSVSCSVVVNGHRAMLEPAEMLGGVREVSWQPIAMRVSGSLRNRVITPRKFYQIEPGQENGHPISNREWLSKVKPGRWSFSSSQTTAPTPIRSLRGGDRTES